MAEKVKKKRITKTLVDPADNLTSKLPRGVIDVIIELLPLRDAARMSVLSKTWLEIWRSIPKLTFDIQFLSSVLNKVSKCMDTQAFFYVVSKILFNHSGHLLKFHLYIPAFYSDVDQWICFLSRTDVSDISIQNQLKTPLKMSSHIFSCGNLEKLRLRSFLLNPPHNFNGFRKMTCLELDEITVTEKALNNLIRGCPLLQILNLTNFNSRKQIIIDIPNLRHLIVDGTFPSLTVKNATNLVSAAFGLQKWVDIGHKASLQSLFNGLASSRTLQKLGFKGHFCKVLYKESLKPPTFAKLRNLELLSVHLNNVDEFSLIIRTIQHCPAIDRLNISVSTSKHETSHILDYNPDSTMHSLCYVDVKICSGSSMELKLIEFLLGCSPILKRLSITSSGDIKSIFGPKMMVQLIRFRRASHKVEVICPEPPVSHPVVSLETDSSDSSDDSFDSYDDFSDYSDSSDDSSDDDD